MPNTLGSADARVVNALTPISRSSGAVAVKAAAARRQRMSQCSAIAAHPIAQIVSATVGSEIPGDGAAATAYAGEAKGSLICVTAMEICVSTGLGLPTPNRAPN